MTPSSINTLQQVDDAINGQRVSLILGAPYQTLPKGSRLARGRETARYAASLNAGYARIIGNQAFIAPFPGAVPSLLLDDLLQDIEIPQSARYILLPFDACVYQATYSQDFRTIESGSEKIIQLTEAVSLLSDASCIVLAAGAYTERFTDTVPGITVTANSLAKYKLRRISYELLRNGLPTSGLIYRIAGAAALSMAILYFLVNQLFSSDPLPITEIIDLGPPQGSDLAYHQLLYLDSLLPELSYFADKYLRTVQYRAGDGVIIAGSIPPAATLQQLIADTTSANLTISFTASGWRVQAPETAFSPNIFPLPPYADTLLALQHATELASFDYTMSDPTSAAGRNTSQIVLVSSLPGYPALRHLAEPLRGRPASVDTLFISYGAGILPNESTLTLQISGQPQ